MARAQPAKKPAKAPPPKAPAKKAAPAPAAKKAAPPPAPAKKAAAAPAPTPIKAAPPPPAPEPEPEIIEDDVADDVTDAEAVADDAPPEVTVFDSLMKCALATDRSFPAPNASGKETEQAFYKRLLSVVNDAADEDWKALSDAAAEWYNKAAQALLDGTPLAVMPGYPAANTAQGAKAPTGRAAGAAALVEHNRKKKAERDAAIARGEIPPKQEREPKVPKEDREPGRVDVIRGYVIDHPMATNAEIEAWCRTQPIGETKMATVAVVRTGTLCVLRLLEQRGRLKP